MTERLKASIINQFTAGEMGFVVMMSLAVNFYPYFLTDVVQISAAMAGTILLVARIVDAISVPITGGIVERTKMKWGKYRSWLFVTPPITALFFVLMFTDFGLSMSAKAVFLGLMYICGHISVNLTSSAHFALIPVIAVDSQDRVQVSCRRAQALSAGQVIFGLIAMPLVVALGGGSEARGFFLTVILFATLQVFGYLLVARVAEPYVSDERLRGESAPTLREMAAQVFSNPPLLVLMVAEVFRWSVGMVMLSFAVYYFKYVAENSLMVTLFFTSLSVSALIGASVGQFIAQKMTKKKTWLLGMSISFLAMSLAWLLNQNPTAFVALASVAGVGYSIVLTLSGALFADVSEYAEWKTGKNARGLIMSLTALPIKIAVAFSGAIVGYGLAAIDFVPNVAPSAQLSAIIGQMATLIPAVFAVLSIIAIQFYSLTDEQVVSMREEISKR